ncbi:hypothetical protein MBLNU457_g2749t1 [Dothideomycetes sp. NU457]
MEPTDRRDSSDSSLSPVPSPHHNSQRGLADTIAVAQPSFMRNVEGVTNQNSTISGGAISAKNTTTTTSSTSEKVKKPRKRKEPDPDGKSKNEEKTKKPRKPRASNPDGTTATNKKQKISTDTTVPTSNTAAIQSRQPTIRDLVSGYQSPKTTPSLQQSTSNPIKAEHLAPSPLSSRPASSGQRFDPIRGMLIEDPAPTRVPSQTSSPSLSRPLPASSVASLINPTMPPKSTAPPLKPKEVLSASIPSRVTNTTPKSKDPHSPSVQSQASVTAPKPKEVHSITTSKPTEVQSPSMRQPFSSPAAKSVSGAVASSLHPEIVKPAPPPSIVHKSASEVTTPGPQMDSKPSSSAATPKAQRHSPPAKRAAPKATGSGLLSSSDLFGGSGTSDDKTLRHGVDIDIHIKLDPAGGNTINMAQEILRKYGADALNPRAAAHRDRLLQVAAAANRLEQGSGDDMSVDLDNADNDSNDEMGGTKDDHATGSAVDGEKPKRTRTKKAEEYDKEDDFIDDTELAWEESAAVAKDGFFVYSGPLIREDQNKADSAAPTRGRGRGRGRGSRGGGVTHAALAAKTTDQSGTTGTETTGGRARGRGTGTTRKPRIKKADRERMEFEKMQREQLASSMGSKMLASAPPATATAATS